MTSPESQPISVLLVEGDPGDVVLTQEAFEHKLPRRDGREVLAVVEAEAALRSIPVVRLPGRIPPPGG